MKKNVKGLAITAILFLFAISVNAQIHLGVKGGLNLSKISGLEDVAHLNYSTSSATGFHLGLMCQLSLPVNFFLQPELLFSMQGAKEEVAGKKETKRLNFLQLPVYAGYKIGVGPVGIILGAGPYLAYGITGSDNAYGKDGIFKRLDAGLSAIAGVQITKFQVTVGYDLGLVDQLDINNIGLNTAKDISIKNRNIKASVGYFF
jgi:hypothetical protein